ncbi:hypothetical protein F4821DRAFT_260015 [Hypoxylon rubiginosum]|uniref:Uncharacterized protein n=1 Tax=Hypoxylon rubiginosum TaxID=110542 RepID=A0ACC0D0S0_9PEZI|nr:hypothetical protein F4821DRAFT_260015 [Hypoxylon rubiginosum]
MLKICPYSARSEIDLHCHNPFVRPHRGSQRRSDAETPQRSFVHFQKLPTELRLQIWELLLPPRIITCPRPLEAYVKFPGEFPSAHFPQFYSTCQESRDLVTKSAVGLMFSDYNEAPVHCEWYDHRRDIFYIPSIGILRLWNRCDAFLRGTVVVNLLEMVEYEYRAPHTCEFKPGITDPHPIFHTLRDVSTIYLSMLTVQWGGDQWDGDLDIYGDDTIAIVDLDDPRLPDLLRPVFANLRELYTTYWGLVRFRHHQIPHKRPSRLLKHLHRKWDDEFKLGFEDQWLLSKLGMSRMLYEYCPKRQIPGLFTKRSYTTDPDYKKLDRKLNRKHELLKPFLDSIPQTRPVIVFEKVYPSNVWKQYERMNPPEKPRFLPNNLDRISNHHGLVLARSLFAGRRAYYS